MNDFCLDHIGKEKYQKEWRSRVCKGGGMRDSKKSFGGRICMVWFTVQGAMHLFHSLLPFHNRSNWFAPSLPPLPIWLILHLCDWDRTCRSLCRLFSKSLHQLYIIIWQMLCLLMKPYASTTKSTCTYFCFCSGVHRIIHYTFQNRNGGINQELLNVWHSSYTY